jgi:hypothetical protein
MRNEPSRLIWPPEPGWFKLRLVPKGWKAPCQIVHLDGQWQAIINGEPRPPHADPALADGVEKVWTWGERIPRLEYDFLLALAGTAPADHPSRHPDRPIDRMTLAPVAVPKRSR